MNDNQRMSRADLGVGLIAVVFAVAAVVGGALAIVNQGSSPDRGAVGSAAGRTPETVSPAVVLDVSWDAEEISGSGFAPQSLIVHIQAMGPSIVQREFSELVVDDERTLPPTVNDVIVDVVAPLVGGRLAEGWLMVDDDQIRMGGTVTSEETALRLSERLSAMTGVVEVDLVVVTPDETSWSVEWRDGPDGGVAVQTGVAPIEASRGLVKLGVADPRVAAGVGFHSSFDAYVNSLLGFRDGRVTSIAIMVEGRDLQVDIRGSSVEVLDEVALYLQEESVIPDLPGEAGESSGHVIALSDEAQARLDIAAIMEDGPIEFVSGSTEPSAASIRRLERIAEILVDYRGISLLVVAHTDSRGNDGANQVLSEAMAASVVELLVAEGVEPERLEAEGRGESEPVADNDTPEGRAANVRVELVIEEM